MKYRKGRKVVINKPMTLTHDTEGRVVEYDTNTQQYIIEFFQGFQKPYKREELTVVR